MLSKYTLADIDVIFKKHPILDTLSKGQRIQAYNQAQDAIAELFKDDSIQITNYTITDNRLDYSTDKERNTINELSEEDKSNIKLGTINLGALNYLIDELDDYTATERTVILNATQDILARLKNDYDFLGYYQLWYNYSTTTYSREYEERFRTSFTTAINELSDFTTSEYNTHNDKKEVNSLPGGQTATNTMSFHTSFSTTISFIAAYLAYESRFRTSFTTSILPFIEQIHDGEARFKTSFTTSVYIPETHLLVSESRFRTSFTTAIV